MRRMRSEGVRGLLSDVGGHDGALAGVPQEGLPGVARGLVQKGQLCRHTHLTLYHCLYDDMHTGPLRTCRRCLMSSQMEMCFCKLPVLLTALSIRAHLKHTPHAFQKGSNAALHF